MKQTHIFLLVLGIIIATSLVMGFGMKSKGLTANVIGEGEVQKIVIGARELQYYPQTITVNVGQPVELTLDASVQGCLRDFTIRSLGIRQYLKTPEDVLRFTPQEKGTYGFACSMGMAWGTLVVE